MRRLWRLYSYSLEVNERLFSHACTLSQMFWQVLRKSISLTGTKLKQQRKQDAQKTEKRGRGGLHMNDSLGRSFHPPANDLLKQE